LFLPPPDTGGSIPARRPECRCTFLPAPAPAPAPAPPAAARPAAPAAAAGPLASPAPAAAACCERSSTAFCADAAPLVNAPAPVTPFVNVVIISRTSAAAV
jgi:hypothetical protein